MPVRIRVLIVEDSAADADFMLAELRRAGLEFDHRRVETETAYVSELSGSRPDVILADYSLPAFNAARALELLGQHALDIPFIVVSGTISEEVAVECMKRGATDYLLKDRLARLGPAISNALSQREVREARRRADAALRESEKRYRLVTEHILDAVFVLDIEGRLVFGNPRSEQLTGYRADELIGRPIAALLTPEGAREAASRTEAVRGGREVEPLFETQLVRKDGAMIWVEASVSTIVENGHAVGRLGVARDITHRRAAEVALRKSEERFRTTFEQAAVGMAIVARDGRFLDVNQRFSEMVGYSRSELAELRFQDITHPDDVDLNVAMRRPTLEKESQAYVIEKRYVHKNGSIVWVHVTASQPRDASGESDYSIGIVQDITARKQLEDELRHAQRMEGVGQLAGGIAHDFNNLLTVISGRAQMSLDRLPPADPLRRELELIHKTSERAAALTRQLLAFSRKQVLQPKVLTPNGLVESLTNLLKRIIGENIELLFVPAPTPGRIRVDPSQLEQVIVNLAVNARDAMPEGGRLTIETANVELDVEYAARHVNVKAGPYIVLAVSDTGTGMSPEIKARIFEPFYTTKGPGRGTGLGLATMYGIVKQSGGHIRVYSEPGAGTTFKIYFPRTDAAPEPTGPATPAAIARGTETVLLVEDEAEVRDLARELLERLGYTVLEASLPTDALEIARQHVGPIDLLLTDVIMPRMSGRSLAKAIAAERPEAKILFMSAYTNDAIVRHGVVEPQTEFLQKPFTAQTLAAKLREVLDRGGRRSLSAPP